VTSSNRVHFEPASISLPFQRLEVEPIPLGGGTTVEVQLATVELDDLLLDASNPRIDYKLKARRLAQPSQDQLAEMLWENQAVKRLKLSIQAAGGLVEPVIVQGSDGAVLEGNCRVVCVRKLRQEHPDDTAWHRVRCRILPPGIDRRTINVLLGELHIAGKNEWKPFERASHLHEMHQRGFDIDELAEMYRLSRGTVQLRLQAYSLMRDEYLPQTSGEVSLLDRWPMFEEFYRRCQPGDDDEGAELEAAFVGWVVDGTLSRADQVRRLPKILADRVAREAFENEGYETAWEVVQTSSPELASRLFRFVVATTTALREAPLSEVARVRSGDVARLRELRALGEALDNFLTEAERGR